MTGVMDDVELEFVDDFDKCQQLMTWMSERHEDNILGLDTETTGLKTWIKDEHGYFNRTVQVGDKHKGWTIPVQPYYGFITELLAKWRGQWAIHNMMFDVPGLRADGFHIPWQQTEDTMGYAALDDPSRRKDLKGLADMYVDERISILEKQLSDTMIRNRWNWATVPINHPHYYLYGATDPVAAAHIRDHFSDVPDRFPEAYDIEMTAIEILSDASFTGTMIDRPWVEQLMQQYNTNIKHKRLEAQTRFGINNPTAPRQVAQTLLRDGVRLTHRTDGGDYQMDEAVLSNIDHPLAALVLEIKHLGKMVQNYLVPFLEMSDPNDRMHASINVVRAITGRMSITNPALQTIPKEFALRNCIRAGEGNSLVLIDYEAMELRVMANISQDPTLIKLFQEGRDPHNVTASKIYGPNFTKKQRGTAKNTIFANYYGAGIDKCAKTAGIPFEEAAKIINEYDATYPGLKRASRLLENEIRQNANGDARGYVTTLNERRIPVKVDKSYVSWNYAIQGSCADILKRKLADLDCAGLGQYVRLPVHDEVIFEVPDEYAEDLLHDATRIMRYEHPDWTVPLTVDGSIYKSWGDKYREAA